jgi:hypothetical protein
LQNLAYKRWLRKKIQDLLLREKPPRSDKNDKDLQDMQERMEKLVKRFHGYDKLATAVHNALLDRSFTVVVA